MSETTQETVKRGFGGSVLLKKNELIFYALNLLLVGPYILARYSPAGWAFSVALLLVMFYFIVLKPDVNEPVLRNLPLMLCLDACIPLILAYQELMLGFTPGNIEYLLPAAQGKLPCLVLLVVGVALCVVKFKDPLLVWMRGLAKAVIGAAFILLLWSDGSLPLPAFMGDAGLFFKIYLLCAIAWCVLCAMSYQVDRRAFPRNNWLSWLLLAVLFAACLTQTRLVQEFFGVLYEWNAGLSGASLAWWKIALLVGGAIAAYDYDYNRMGADSLFLGALAGGALVLRALMSYRFPLWQVLPLAFLVSTLCCLQNELKGKKTLRLLSPLYLAAQTGAALLAVLLMHRDLWLMLILLILYGVIFYVTAEKMTTPPRQLVWWLIMLSFPPVLAAAFLWQTSYFVTQSFTLLAAAYVVLALAVVILNWPHPNRRTSPGPYKWIICGLMAVLSLLSALV